MLSAITDTNRRVAYINEKQNKSRFKVMFCLKHALEDGSNALFKSPLQLKLSSAVWSWPALGSMPAPYDGLSNYHTWPHYITFDCSSEITPHFFTTRCLVCSSAILTCAYALCQQSIPSRRTSSTHPEPTDAPEASPRLFVSMILILLLGCKPGFQSTYTQWN